MTESYYTILGVPRSASTAQIKSAYYSLIRQVHPDAVPNASPYWKKLAEEKAKEINEAYSVLSDSQKRRLYDAQLDLFYQQQSGVQQNSTTQSQTAGGPNANASAPNRGQTQTTYPASAHTSPPARTAFRSSAWGLWCLGWGVIWCFSLVVSSSISETLLFFTLAFGSITWAAWTWASPISRVLLRLGISNRRNQICATLATIVVVLTIARGIGSTGSKASAPPPQQQSRTSGHATNPPEPQLTNPHESVQVKWDDELREAENTQKTGAASRLAVPHARAQKQGLQRSGDQSATSSKSSPVVASLENIRPRGIATAPRQSGALRDEASVMPTVVQQQPKTDAGLNGDSLAVRTPSSQLRTSDLTYAERQSLESACSSDKHLSGPAAYDRCLQNQLAELAKGPRRPNLSGLSSPEQQSIESACSSEKHLSGPAAYNRCLQNQLAELENGPRRPDLSGLSYPERQSIESACSSEKHLSGPAAYNRCLQNQLAELAKGPHRPNLSGLSYPEQQSIESACSSAKHLSGPAAYNRCLQNKLAELGNGPRRPDLSGLSYPELQSIESACSSEKHLSGPAAYNRCLIRQLRELRGGR